MTRGKTWVRWGWVLPVVAALMAMLACSGGAGDTPEPTTAPAEPTQEASELLIKPTQTESSSGGFEGDTGSGETYGEYVAVTDDTKAIQVEVPVKWSDVNGAPWTSDNGADFASIWAAPNLQDFQESWGTPGIQFNVTADKEKLGGHIEVLDWSRSWDFLGDCELDSRYDYNDGLYRGAYDYYEKCGGTTDYMVLAAVPIQDSGDVLILLEVQIVSDADLDAAERILSTFDIVGSLP
jgi:serine protease Do